MFSQIELAICTDQAPKSISKDAARLFKNPDQDGETSWKETFSSPHLIIRYGKEGEQGVIKEQGVEKEFIIF